MTNKHLSYIVIALGIILAFYSVTKGTTISTEGSSTEQNTAIRNSMGAYTGLVIMFVGIGSLLVIENQG